MMLPFLLVPEPILIQSLSEEEEICNFINNSRHIGLLLEKIRREGYEFSVTPPEIVFKEDPKTRELLEPI